MAGAEPGLPQSTEELGRLRKWGPRKALCAALVKGRTPMKNEWLANLLCMGHPAAMSQLVSRARKEPKALKTVLLDAAG